MASIYERKMAEGGTSFQVLIRKAKAGQEPIRISAAFDTLEEAQKFVKTKEAEIQLGLYQPKTSASRVTLLEAFTRYIEEVTPLKKGAQAEKYKIATILKSSLANRFLSDITQADIAKYRDSRLKVAAANTVRHELAVISHLYTVAQKEWGFEVTNKVASIRPPKPPRGRSRRLMPGEIDRVLAHSESPFLKDITVFALETAMRQAEIVSFCWKSVDLKKKVVTLEDTKNGEKRVVPLSTTAHTILSALTRPLSPSKPVFDITSHAVAVAWRRAVSRAHKAYVEECTTTKTVIDTDYLVGLHFHDLRHEATSRFFEKGLGVMEVSAITGHKTLQMLKRYTHLKVAEDLVAKLAGS